MRIFCSILLFCLSLSALAQTGQTRYIDSLLVQLPRQQNDTLKVRMLQDISFAYSYSNPDQGIFYAGKALALAEQLQYQRGIASSNSMLAISYNIKSDNAKAIAFNEKALAIYTRLRDKKSTAAIYTNMMVIYLSQSRYSEGLKCGFEALKILEKLNNTESTAVVLENIGHIYFEQKDYDTSEDYYEKALAIYTQSGNKTDIARCTGNLARVFGEKKEYKRTLAYLFKALKATQELGMPKSVQSNLANIGNVYVKLKDYPKAIQYHGQALAISEQLGIKSSIAINNGNLGSTYLEMAKVQNPDKNLRLSIGYLEKAIAICREIGFPAPQIEFTQCLSEAHKLAGNFKMAFETLQSSTSLKDSVFSQQSKIDLANLEAKRDIELKNKDITIKNKQLKINKLQAANSRILYLSGILSLFLIIFAIARYYILRARSHRNAMSTIIQRQSHDIRGPVVSILGLSQLLNLNEADDPANKEIIEGISALAAELDEVTTKAIRDSREMPRQ